MPTPLPRAGRAAWGVALPAAALLGLLPVPRAAADEPPAEIRAEIRIDGLEIHAGDVLLSPDADAGGAAAAQPAPAAGSGATAPAAVAAKPADAAQIKALIAQLGDDRYKVRDEATSKLLAIGKPALPALKEAAQSTDPEVQGRARKLVQDLEAPPRPAAVAAADDGTILLHNGGRIVLHGGGQFQVQAHVVAGGQQGMRVSVTNINGNTTKEVDVDENGRKIHIHEDKEGLALTVTEKDAKAPKEYKAKDADELKKNDPEAYKLYEKYSGGNLGGLNGAIHFQPAVRIAPVPQPPRE